MDAVGGSGGGWVAAGAGYAGRSSGKWLFEVEVLAASGSARVGIAGTNFRKTKVGGDEASWAIFFDGDTSHRCAVKAMNVRVRFCSCPSLPLA